MSKLNNNIPYERVDSHFLVHFTSLVKDLNGDPSLLLRQVGIEPHLYFEGIYKPSYHQAVSLISLAAAQLDCSDFGMRLATLQAGSIHSPLFELMENSNSLGQALEHVEAHSYMHSPAAAMRFQRCVSTATAAICHDILLEGAPGFTQAMEQILLLGCLTIAQVTGGLAKPKRVVFRHQPVSSQSTYRRYFGCEVNFGCSANAIVFRHRDVMSPTVSPNNTALAAVLTRIHAQFRDYHPPFHARVRALITHFIGHDACTSSAIAEALRVSVRGMHRQLQLEQTSFQRIKNDVRRDLALYYLEHTSLGLVYISERLGFAEQSALTHFCWKWFDASPTVVRSRARKQLD